MASIIGSFPVSFFGDGLWFDDEERFGEFVIPWGIVAVDVADAVVE